MIVHLCFHAFDSFPPPRFHNTPSLITLLLLLLLLILMFAEPVLLVEVVVVVIVVALLLSLSFICPYGDKISVVRWHVHVRRTRSTATRKRKSKPDEWHREFACLVYVSHILTSSVWKELLFGVKGGVLSRKLLRKLLITMCTRSCR